MMEKRDRRGNSLNLPKMSCCWVGSREAWQENIEKSYTLSFL
jgi:hypothetical protein